MKHRVIWEGDLLRCDYKHKSDNITYKVSMLLDPRNESDADDIIQYFWNDYKLNPPPTESFRFTFLDFSKATYKEKVPHWSDGMSQEEYDNALDAYTERFLRDNKK